MLVFGASLLAILGFAIVFIYLRVVQISRMAIQKSYSGVAAMLDNTLCEEEKEAAVQAAGLSLLKAAFQIFWRFVAALVAAVVPIYLLDVLGIVSAEVVTTLMSRLDYILVTTIVLAGAGWAFTSFRHSTSDAKSSYSRSDQITHRLAFSGPSIQLTAADIEDRLFTKRIHKIKYQPPIFITSLPRAGTTIMLMALNSLPSVATHLYRDMPFVMAPLLWSNLSRLFAKQSKMKERAHGDSIQIGYDSPEAFEEILWKTFWPEKYGQDSIELWHADDVKSDASTFFIQHFRKIVALRTDGGGRYVSKNNGNIARLDLLPKMFPGAHIVVPLREPAEHAASLLRQHENFIELHNTDPFIKRYMRDIGHLEFGTLHKPFAFPSFYPKADLLLKADYWLDYWIATYQMVLKRADRLYFVSQDRVCKQPEVVMNALCEKLTLDTKGFNLAEHFRPINKKVDKGVFDTRKLAKATEIYHALRKHEI